MYTHEVQIRVRYGETDQMGFIYYGNYALYYEVGRTEALRNLGFTYRGLEEKGIMLPVIKLESTYLRAAHYDDLITVKTRLETLPLQSEITFISELFNEKGKLINRGEVTLTFYDSRAKKKTKMPIALREALVPFFDANKT